MKTSFPFTQAKAWVQYTELNSWLIYTHVISSTSEETEGGDAKWLARGLNESELGIETEALTPIALL